MSSAIPARPRCRSWTRSSTRRTSATCSACRRRPRSAWPTAGRWPQARAAFVNLHAMGGLGNAMGVLVASKASETPLVVTAGQQDTRHLMTEPWLSGDLVALAEPVTKWAKEVRRGEDVGQALRRAFEICRTPPCGPVFLSLPMDILDQEVTHPTPPRVRAAAPRPFARRGAPRGDARRPRSGPGRRPARRRSAGRRERRTGRLRRGRRLSGLGNAAHFPHRLSLRASLLGGRAEARFRRHARPLQGGAGDRAGRRTRLRRLSPIATPSPCPRASRSCMSPTTRRRSAANTPPTWRSLATSALTLTRRPRVSTSRRPTRTRSRRGSLRARRTRARPRQATRLDILAESANPPLTRRRGGAGGARRAAAGRADRQRFRRDLRPRAGFADDPARPLFLRPRRRARLQHAGGGRRGARDPGLGRLVRRRRRGDVFAAGAVERRPLSARA